MVLIVGGDNNLNPSQPILGTAELFHPGPNNFTCVGGQSGSTCNSSMTDARESGRRPCWQPARSYSLAARITLWTLEP